MSRPKFRSSVKAVSSISMKEAKAFVDAYFTSAQFRVLWNSAHHSGNETPTQAPTVGAL